LKADCNTAREYNIVKEADEDQHLPDPSMMNELSFREHNPS